MKYFIKETAIEAFQRVIYGFGFGGGMSIAFGISSGYGIEKPEQKKQIKLQEKKAA
jgi:hypothetical protein